VKFDNENIDLSQIKKYLEGKLSQEDKYAFEAKMEADPFLYEAVEGYQENPAALERIAKLKKDHAASQRSFFGSRTLAVLGVAAAVYIIALMIDTSSKDKQEITLDTSEIEEVKEVEVVPESIDSFVLAEVDEQIPVQEIVQNKQLMEEIAQDETSQGPDVIHIDEDHVVEDDHEIIPEQDNSNKTIYAPSTYLFDLYVVDYREIKRKNASISYTRYELSGLSAEYENDESKSSSDLIEKHVEVPYMEYLKTSMDYFSSGSYKKALNRYLTIIEQYPEDLNAHFYGGHCYFNLRKYDKALDFFEKTLQYEGNMNFVAFRQEAKWYKAMSLIKVGKKSQAVSILNEIIADGLFYAEDAIKLKEKL
jgi:TolA-binding protein